MATGHQRSEGAGGLSLFVCLFLYFLNPTPFRGERLLHAPDNFLQIADAAFFDLRCAGLVASFFNQRSVVRGRLVSEERGCF